MIRGLRYGAPGNDVSFEDDGRIHRPVIPAGPDQKDILAIAEQKIPATDTPAQVINWFEIHPPVSLSGVYRYIDALNATGRAKEAARLVRTRWIEGDFTPDELTAFQTRFASLLDAEAIGRGSTACSGKMKRAPRSACCPMSMTARKRWPRRGLRSPRGRACRDFVSHVPGYLQDDPGLLYERLRRDVRENRDEEAMEILRRPPDDLRRPRAAGGIMRQIEDAPVDGQADYKDCLQLATEHGQTGGKHAYCRPNSWPAGWPCVFSTTPTTAVRILNRCTTMPDPRFRVRAALIGSAARARRLVTTGGRRGLSDGRRPRHHLLRPAGRGAPLSRCGGEGDCRNPISRRPCARLFTIATSSARSSICMRWAPQMAHTVFPRRHRAGDHARRFRASDRACL